MSIYFGIFLFFIGQVLGWFQLNSQYVSDWWKDKPFVAACLIGVPTSIAFWYAWRVIVEATGSVWTARFIGSSTGIIIFPILTWYLLGESMFVPKTMICLGLAILIILIQLLW
tara:strand:+ start:213 stop:551 length:339 start_codon:yes stop_codon:yes gene_type:complete